MTSDELRKLYSDALRNLAGPLDEALAGLCGKRVGFALFVFGLTADGKEKPDGISYMSNAVRSEMIEAVREWLALQDAGITSGPPGPKPKG